MAPSSKLETKRSHSIPHEWAVIYHEEQIARRQQSPLVTAFLFAFDPVFIFDALSGDQSGGPLERNQSQQSNKPHNRDHNAENSLALLAYKMMCQAGSGLYPPAKSDEPASQRINVMDRAVDSQHESKYTPLSLIKILYFSLFSQFI